MTKLTPEQQQAVREAENARILRGMKNKAKPDPRLARIKASVDKINTLMKELHNANDECEVVRISDRSVPTPSADDGA